ncbi:MAG: hypothetical protein C0423_05845 [Methylibium sp.]|nr:hypothetical protein [Methylibium sp.]
MKLGPLTVASWQSLKPFEGTDFRIAAEALGMKPDGHNADLTVHDLCGVKAADLPDSLHLTVGDPRLGFSAIDSLSVQTDRGRCTLMLSLHSTYDQFHLPCNLIQFMDRLAAVILASSAKVSFHTSKAAREEFVGIRIEAGIDLSPVDDLGKVAIDAAAQVLDCYKALVSEILAEAKHAAEMARRSGREPGAVRWWTKEFIVPLATSGVLGGLAAWLIARWH